MSTAPAPPNLSALKGLRILAQGSPSLSEATLGLRHTHHPPASKPSALFTRRACQQRLSAAPPPARVSLLLSSAPSFDIPQPCSVFPLPHGPLPCFFLSSASQGRFCRAPPGRVCYRRVLRGAMPPAGLAAGLGSLGWSACWRTSAASFSALSHSAARSSANLRARAIKLSRFSSIAK